MDAGDPAARPVPWMLGRLRGQGGKTWHGDLAEMSQGLGRVRIMPWWAGVGARGLGLTIWPPRARGLWTIKAQ